MPNLSDSAEDAAGRVDVLLITMPLSPVDRPSLGLTLLAEVLKQQGISARVHYPNLQFLERIGQAAYDRLSLNQFANATLAGEWLFSRLACPAGDMATYLDHLRQRLDGDMGWMETDEDFAALAEALPELMAAAAALVEAVAEEVGHCRPRVVGFSSCYNQHLASLAAARLIKERFADCFVVLGGVNCTGEMGLETFRRFPFLDAVVAGPGEVALPPLVREVLGGTPMPAMPGVYRRDQVAVPGTAPEPVLDTLPVPDFCDFARAVEPEAPWVLPLEASRGCWWGQKHHCVFCSENAESMRYRAKSPERIRAEVAELGARFPGRRMAFTDEILDPRLIAAGLPSLPAGGFVSVKANLSRTQVAALAGAGFDALQPGIESLDDDILEPMRKGVSALRNIQLLKWCRESGIRLSWAVLFGFPFDRPEPYQRMAELMPALCHLSPPGLARVVLQRYSPLTRDADRFGYRQLRPNPSYRFIYPFASAALERLAYRFVADWHSDAEASEWWRPVWDAVAAWKAAAGTAFLFHQDDGERLFICDTRPQALCFLHTLTGVARTIYLACDAAQPEHALRKRLGPDQDPEPALKQLRRSRLVVTDKALNLALGYRLNLRALPPPAVMSRFLAARAEVR